jgi:hypothetical protein
MDSCVGCKNNGGRRIEQDASDSIGSFKAYWCESYKSIVHDYYTLCSRFSNGCVETVKKCEIHNKDLPCVECQAEQQKKRELYDPDTCPDQDEPGCTYPVCHDCNIDYGYDEEDW